MKSLRHLGLFITESCNLACPYCFAANMERQIIDVDLARRAIDLLFLPEVTSKEVKVTFWGGEPLKEFDLLKELALYARAKAKEHGKKVALGLPTNATLLSNSKIDFLKKHEIGISLSLDGAAKAQALRKTRGGKSSFPIIEKKLVLIKERYGENLPGVRMTVSPDTAADFCENVVFFLNQGFRAIFFAPVHEADWQETDFANFEREQNKLADLRAEEFKNGRSYVFNSWDKIIAWREMTQRGQVDAKSMKILCGAGTSMLSVDISGDIYPCHRFVFYDKTSRAQALGNVGSGLPTKEKMRPYAEIDADNVGTTDHRCADCPDLQNCLGVCPAVNYSMNNGDIHGVNEIQCELGRIENRAVTRFEKQVAALPNYQNYVENYLLKVFAPGALSAEMVAFFSGLSEEVREQAADRALEIMTEIRNRRS